LKKSSCASCATSTQRESSAAISPFEVLARFSFQQQEPNRAFLLTVSMRMHHQHTRHTRRRRAQPLRVRHPFCFPRTLKKKKKKKKKKKQKEGKKKKTFNSQGEFEL
jgi:hypothetical protein